MGDQALPNWLGGYEPPLMLAQSWAVLEDLSVVCIGLAQHITVSGPRRHLVALEFSRWLGVAVSQLQSVAPHPVPELLRRPPRDESGLARFAAIPPILQIDALTDALATLAHDEGWGNRNIAFCARQLHQDLQWWKDQANLLAVLC